MFTGDWLSCGSAVGGREQGLRGFAGHRIIYLMQPDDDDFWTTYIASTPEEDNEFRGMGRIILWPVIVLLWRFSLPHC